MSKLPLSNIEVQSGPFPLKVSLNDTDRTLFSESARPILIYLRNIGVPTEKINLDFSCLTYEEKEKFLIEYAMTDIDVRIKELDTSWRRLTYDSSSSCILTEDEIKTWNAEHSELTYDVKIFCKSLLFWIADEIAKKKNNHIGTSWTEITSFKTFSVKNMLSVLIGSKDLSLIAWDQTPLMFFKDSMKPKFLQDVLVLKLTADPKFIMVYGSRTKEWEILKNLLRLAK